MFDVVDQQRLAAENDAIRPLINTVILIVCPNYFPVFIAHNLDPFNKIWQLLFQSYEFVFVLQHLEKVRSQLLRDVLAGVAGDLFLLGRAVVRIAPLSLFIVL
jgi:hypothetical protein